ncbi:MAG: magnesium/cobalt transporter CorA [Deltaproteobacteria bacterium]|nr:magnesium/cobalt transporter CorA [Deltaproteobacteria bacterium]
MGTTKRRNRKFGLPPGSLVYTGTKTPGNHTEILKVEYSSKDFNESKSSIQNLKISPEKTNWLIFEGVHDSNALEQLGKLFNIHRLALEDVMNISQRPKMEEFGKMIFLVLPIVTSSDNRYEKYNINLFLTENTVILISEKFETDLWEPLFNRLRDPAKTIRKNGVAYLLFSILDIIVDHYIDLSSEIDDHLFDLRISMTRDDSITFERILEIQNNILYLRKTFNATRETLSGLMKHSVTENSEFKFFLRDSFDHLVQVIESVDFNFMNLDGLINLHFSKLNQKMNEIIKFLTLISTMFIPASFIVGFYGMNFKYMPELNLPYAYPLVVVVIALVISSLFVMFRRKKWM